jgi:hypothetical protein
LHDVGFLRFLRKKPCCICGREGETEAAHIRIGFRAMAKKPDDRFATPLCGYHHREQHSMGEQYFWEEDHDLDPFAIAARLYAEYGGTGGKPKKKRAAKPRKPKSQRAKINSRPFQKRSKR